MTNKMAVSYLAFSLWTDWLEVEMSLFGFYVSYYMGVELPFLPSRVIVSWFKVSIYFAPDIELLSWILNAYGYCLVNRDHIWDGLRKLR